MHVINFYKPVVQSAYDYYPFGMLMPGRNTEDNTSHCVTLTETKLVMRIVPSFSVWTVPDVVLHGGGSVVITTGTGIHTGGGVLVTPSNPEAYVTYDMSGLSIPLGVPQSIQLQAGDVTRTLMAQVIQDDTMMIGSNTVPMGADLFANIMFTPVSSNLKLKISLLPVGGPWTGGTYKVWGTTYGSDTIYESMPIVTTECTDGMYRYGHNGKFKDNEWAGVGNHYNYGYRLQDSRTGRFLSRDPLTGKFPMLTPYQFASNTPIQAVDLDGLEAAVIGLGGRTTVLFVTVATNVSVVGSRNGISLYITPEAGLAGGVSIGGGMSFAYYPNMKNSEDYGGWGVNIGGSVMGNGGDLSVSMDAANNVTKAGLGAGVPKTGAGVGAEGHLSIGYSFLVKTESWDNIGNSIQKLAEQTNISPAHLAQAVAKVKSYVFNKKDNATQQPATGKNKEVKEKNEKSKGHEKEAKKAWKKAAKN